MKKLKLFYYSENENFGDALSVFISRKLYNKPVALSPATRCNAVFIGSLLHCFLTKKNLLARMPFLLFPAVSVWGAGFIERPDLVQQKLLRRLDVYACRGYLTLESLKSSHCAGVAKNVVIADPGILAGRLTDTAGTEKKYSLGVIPHYVDKNSPLLSGVKVENSVVIDIQQKPETVIRRISECENIISSSLHGLIAADSLNIPNVRMVLSDKISGGDYKYNDYYSAFGLDEHEKIILAQREFTDKDLPGIKAGYRIRQEEVTRMQDALLAVFPFR